MSSTIERGPKTLGRPPKTEADVQQMRRRIIDATRAVFAEKGYHDLSVELVLIESKLSRPTFYKYFRSTEEPIKQVLAEVNQQLIDALIKAVVEAPDPIGKLDAALVAWRDWGTALGPMLKTLFSELHDKHSPASRHRLHTLKILAENLGTLIHALGRERPSRLQLDALINGIEYLGYRYHLETPADTVSWKETRDAMLRMAIGLLASQADWSEASTLAQALNILPGHTTTNVESAP